MPGMLEAQAQQEANLFTPQSGITSRRINQMFFLREREGPLGLVVRRTHIVLMLKSISMNLNWQLLYIGENWLMSPNLGLLIPHVHKTKYLKCLIFDVTISCVLREFFAYIISTVSP